MRTRVEFRTLLWPVLLCLVLCFSLGCESRDQLVGTYVADAKDTPKLGETALELKDNAVGVWKVGDEEVTFSWYKKGDQLRVNTKNGGVIVGEIDKDVIRITLPGSKMMVFKKVK
ncbi:MAG: hypothetical protein LLG06_00895 [Desulfobacteraceae bacterium]|nr:hypothetical protein [Desulfobacteraceae bacterium]